MNARVFPKHDKRLATKVYDALNPPQVFERESFNKIPIPLAQANQGRRCAWCVPYDVSGAGTPSVITGVTQYYPMSRTDLSSIMQEVMTANSSIWPVGQQYNAYSLINNANASMELGSANSMRPSPQIYFRLGAFYTYTITNVSNAPIYVTGFRVAARKNLPRANYGENILALYAQGLWNSGLGTNTSTSITESSMDQYFHSNTVDLFDASTFLHLFKVKTKTTFTLPPGKSKSFSIRLRSRIWNYNDLFADFQNTPQAVDMPWSRIRGVPEYVFKYTTGDGGIAGQNYYPAANPPGVGLPDYSMLDYQPVGIAALSYSIKYYIAPRPQRGLQYHSLISVTGQGTSTAGSTKTMTDNTLQPSVPAYA